MSAIRKWRRMGLVADRKISSPGGIERVEVRLEDVVARAAMHPDRQPIHEPGPSGDDAGEIPALPPGHVVVTIPDLESLFERMVDAERRARQAEEEAESLRGQARFMYGQLSELRRQLEASVGHPSESSSARLPEGKEPVGAGPVSVAQADKVPVPPPATRRVALVGERLGTNGSPPSNGEQRNGSDTVRHRPPPRAVRPTATPDEGRPEEDVLGRLRRIYGRLDEFRREEVVTPEIERQRELTLAAYDRELLAVCAALRLPTGLADGEPVTVESRAALTRALARAGFDVRAGLTQPPTQKVRRIRSGLRF